MPKFNDIDLKNWKSYDDVNTESLWLIKKRKKDSLNKNVYHGNFVPQIPEQIIKRYTKKGDIVFDPFIGSGTTIYECIYAQRIGIGVDLSLEMINYIKETIGTAMFQTSDYGLFEGDSTNPAVYEIVKKYLKKFGKNKVQHVILHPPYNDIIKFSSNFDDLSNKDTLEDFLDSFSQVVKRSLKLLEKDRYLSLVIGDQYKNSELIPLSSLCMNICLQEGLLLKGIVVKDYQNTKGKSGNYGLWRYRALASDFYTFKHEYIYIFKKIKK